MNVKNRQVFGVPFPKAALFFEIYGMMQLEISEGVRKYSFYKKGHPPWL